MKVYLNLNEFFLQKIGTSFLELGSVNNVCALHLIKSRDVLVFQKWLQYHETFQLLE
jgi:hypothetical protein